MPLSELLTRKLETERSWLGRQALFQSGWDRGCSAVARTLEAWVEEYAKQLLVGTGLPESVRQGCLIRVWSAWAYHWEQAVRRSPSGQADGMAAASAARAGVRLGHPHPMGGDPLRDAVLVETCLAGLNLALNRFHTEYQATFKQEIRRAFHREPDWELWEDLFVKLVGSTREEGKLTEFRGYTSLRAWLRPIARHFVLDRCRLEQIRRLAERRAALLHTPETTAPDSVELEETLAWSKAQVARALAALDDRDRLLLMLRFRSGWSSSAIADLLKVHPGHFSRLLVQATEYFRLQLESPWEQLFQEYDSSTVAYFLFRGLNDVRPEELAVEAHGMTIAEEPVMSTTQDKSKKKSVVKKPAKSAKKRQLMEQMRERAEAKRRTESRKAATSKPTQGKKVVVPARAEQLPEVGLAELERFLPEKLVAAKVNDRPEDLFARSEDQPAEQRPAVICLDAREEGSLERVIDWLERFDAVVSEQYEDEAREPYDPQRVVVVRTDAPEPAADWRTREYLDWVPTEDMDSDVLTFYRLYLRSDLHDLVNEDLEGFFPAAPAGKTERLSDLLPTSKLDAWKARVKEFEEREDEP